MIWRDKGKIHNIYIMYADIIKFCQFNLIE